MIEFDILHPGVWFGPKPQQNEVCTIEDAVGETELLHTICLQMKLGTFAVRRNLQDLIECGQNALVRQQAIRLYCYTCRHQDIDFLGNLLNRLQHDDVITVIATSPDTLSPEIIPFLFALLGEYEETSSMAEILAAINRLFPWGYDARHVDLVWLANHFSGFAKKLISDAYYYAGEPAHPGKLCKSLIESTAHARHNNSTFPVANIPILLSNWSGERCPIYYGELVDNSKMQDVFDYVSNIAKLPWVHGAKYFYGNRVE